VVPPAAGGPAPGLSGYDAELRRHNEVLRRALGVQLHDRVLDIGCGTGQTTRLAAHLSEDGVWFGSRAWIVTARRSEATRPRSAR
jgi:cyclopropane fatty-acyl-phospholipid synthase-like methyltransferase